MAHEAAFVVDEVRVAEDHGGTFALRFGRCRDAGQRVGRVELVAGVEKYDVVARSHVDGLVHGIVEPLVGLADARNLVAHGGERVAFLVVVDVR